MSAQRIAVLTSGGDAPGMNAAIRAATRMGVECGLEMFGVRRGYAGLIAGDFVPLGPREVGGIVELGGTMLHSARSPQFPTPAGLAQASEELRKARIDGLLVIGGNGSQSGACALSKAGVQVNGIASTIDNDLYGSTITIGVDSALNVALEAIDRLRTTALSHQRVIIVEVMGRNCGYLALAAGLAGGAEVIVTPEMDLPPPRVAELIHMAHKRHKRHAIVVVAEGARNNGKALYEALSGAGEECFEPRLTVLGHVQRGARPTAFDRLLATRLGARAAKLIAAGAHGQLVGLMDDRVTATPLAEVAGRTKPLPAELLELAETMQL